MPRTFLSSDCIVLIIVMIQCCIIICVIFCIGCYILVEIKLQCSCIAIKLLSYCTSYMYYVYSRVKEVKSETKSGQTCNRSHKPVHNFATTGAEGHKGQKSIKAITEGKLRNLTSSKVETLQPNADCFGIRA